MRISGTSRLCGLETGSGFLALFLGCYVNRPSLERPERGDGHGAILDDLADQARNHHLQRLRGPEALGERAPGARLTLGPSARAGAQLRRPSGGAVRPHRGSAARRRDRDREGRLASRP